MLRQCSKVDASISALSLPLVLLLSSSTLPAWSAPMTFNTALPVAQGEFVARIQGIHTESGDDPGLADRDMTVDALVTVLGYGATPKLALFGVLPYQDKTLKLTNGGQRIRRSQEGFGDLSLFGRYTLFQRDQPGRTLRLAPFFGIEAPTGKDDASDALGRLPPSVQLGSGAWDLFGGLVLTHQTLNDQIDSQLSVRFNDEANGFEAGDEARWDLSWQHRLWPRELGSGVPGFLYGVLESNLVYQSKNEVNGVKDANSGGTSLFLAPGLQYVTKRWIAETAIQLPVIQDLNGTALENDYIFRAGIRFNF